MSATIGRRRAESLRRGQIFTGGRRIVGVVDGFSHGRPVVYVTTIPRALHPLRATLADMTCQGFDVVDYGRCPVHLMPGARCELDRGHDEDGRPHKVAGL